MTSRSRKAIAGCLLALTLVLGPAVQAWAHDPIFITDDQTTPDTGPFMPDGSISWALYGAVLSDGDTRGFEFDLRDGDELFVSLLIPNLVPETDLADEDLPVIELEAPDGSVTIIEAEIREVFDEPFSQTSYVTLAEHRGPAQAGRYRGLILGNAASRFSVAIGETEIFFTETERSGDRPTTFAEITGPLTAWYTTPAGGEQDTSQLAAGEAEIDLDLIEEAVESGEAEAPEGSADASVDPESEADIAVDAEPATDADDSAASADGDDDDDDAENEVVAQESPESETASAPLTTDDGGGATWVAPAAIGAVALLGGGAFLARGRGAESA